MKHIRHSYFILVATTVLVCVVPSLADSLRLEGRESGDLEVAPISLTPMRSWQREGEPVPYDLRMHITNSGAERRQDLHLAVEARRRDGTVRSFSGFPLSAAVYLPGTTAYTQVLVRGLTTGSDDLVTVGIWDEVGAAARVRDSLGGDLCEVFCEVCTDRAQTICSCGVQSFTCSCGPRSCSFTCFPCPE